MTWWKVFPFLEWVNWLDLPLKPSSTCLGSSSLLRPDAALFCPFGNWMDCLSLRTKTFTKWQKPVHASTTCPSFLQIACHRWHGRNTPVLTPAMTMQFVADLLKSFIGHWCAAKIICDKSCFEQCTNGNVMCNVAWRNAQLGTEKRAIRHGEMRN